MKTLMRMHKDSEGRGAREYHSDIIFPLYTPGWLAAKSSTFLSGQTCQHTARQFLRIPCSSVVKFLSFAISRFLRELLVTVVIIFCKMLWWWFFECLCGLLSRVIITYACPDMCSQLGSTRASIYSSAWATAHVSLHVLLNMGASLSPGICLVLPGPWEVYFGVYISRKVRELRFMPNRRIHQWES